MKANNGSIIATIIVCTVLLGLAFFIAMPEVPTEAGIAASVLVGVTIPTAQEVADLVVIPDTTVSTEKSDQVWELIFGNCADDVKSNAESDVEAEVNADNKEDLKDFIEDSIEDFDKFQGSLILDNDETETDVTAFGYCPVGTVEIGEDDDDKSATVTLVYDFRYENTEDDTEHKGSVIVTGTVVYDEGDFSDEDVELSYAIA